MARKGHKAARDERYTFLLYIMVLGLLVVAGRLVFLQVVAGPAHAAQALDQRTTDVELTPRRGSIYDREGQPLAVTMEARTIYAVPHAVEDATGTAQALASILGGESQTYLDRLHRDSGFVYIARKVDMNKAAAVEALEINGIEFQEDSRRTYPSGELACQVLGFVGVDDAGLAGLEQYYDDLLAGSSGSMMLERDPFGRPIPGGISQRIEATDGSDIVLTIDKDIQYEAQVALSEAVQKWGAKSGTIIVLNPQDGEVYAMASVPGFNPNAFGSADEAAYRNRAVTDVFEPGSTVKSLTAAAVIEEGLFGPESMFVLPPTIKLGGRTIGEAHSRPTVTWSLTDIVTNSSNVGAVRLGQALGPEGLYRHFVSFGLDEPTGIDYPGETQGYLPAVDSWSASSIGNIPFGQGFSVTPLQLCRALAVIANGGDLVTPHLLLSTPDDPDTRPAWATKPALDPAAAKTTNEVLKAVVTEGTGSSASVAGYQVAGKTGTAQKAVPGVGYAGGKYVGSFIGYLPADDPQVLVLVSLDEPSNAIYGGTVAAPTFSRVAQFAVSHLKIPPATDASTDETVTVSGAP